MTAEAERRRVTSTLISLCMVALAVGGCEKREGRMDPIAGERVASTTAPAASSREVDGLIERYRKATGRSTGHPLRSLRVDGKIHTPLYPSAPRPLIFRMLQPDSLQWAERRKARDKEVAVVLTLQGHSAWMEGTKLMGTTNLPPSAPQMGKDVANVRRKLFELALGLVPDVVLDLPGIRTRHESTGNNDETIVISDQFGEIGKLYFSDALPTHFTIRRSGVVPSLGSYDVTLRYEEWREEDGLLFPHLFKREDQPNQPGASSQRFEFHQYSPNAAIPTTMFGKVGGERLQLLLPPGST
jgi:hypothetical protein